jgi:hypothetical protein
MEQNWSFQHLGIGASLAVHLIKVVNLSFQTEVEMKLLAV